MNMTKSFGLGLIGCGDFGRFCMEVFAKIPQVRPAAVADVVKASADAMAKDFAIAAHYSPAELIARDDVQIVHIATPPASHHELVMAAIKAGKHVLCEKPLAMNVAQADEMIDAARKADVVMPVNFVLRYNAITDAVKAIIDSGVMGKVLAARLTNCASDHKLTPKHWFWDKSVSGGIFIEHGVHFFDLYSHWLGEGEVIDAHAELREGTGQEDRVTCTLRYGSGAVASHYHGFDQALPMDRTDHRLVCELGDIRVDEWIPITLTVDAAVNADTLGELVDCCPGCDVEVVSNFADIGEIFGRGQSRKVDRRVRLRYEPSADKQTVYADSVRQVLADQIAYLNDRTGARRVTESNGRDAVALAQAADELAGRDR